MGIITTIDKQRIFPPFYWTKSCSLRLVNVDEKRGSIKCNLIG